MFYWKNAIVLVGLLILAAVPLFLAARSNWERAYTAKLGYCAALIACITVSFFSIIYSQILFALLLLLCFDRRVPMVATYFFFLVWTPQASAHLVVAGAYFVPLKPMIAMSIAMMVGYMLHPEMQLARRTTRTDLYLFAFLLIFWLSLSRSDSTTSILRNFLSYVIPYGLTYGIASRTRIERPELALRFLVFGMAGAALLCIFELVRTWPLYSALAPLKGLWVLVDSQEALMMRSGYFRAFGPFSHPLVGSAVMGMGAVAAYGLTLLHKRQPGLYLLGGIIVLGVLSTISRTGVVAMVVGLAMMQILRGRYVPVVLTGILGAVVLFGIPMLSGSDASSTGAYRLTLLMGVPQALGAGMILGNPAAVQMGLLDAFVQGEGIVDLVNIYLSILVMGGLVSLLPLLLFFGSTFTSYARFRRLKPSPEQLVVAQVCVSIQAAYLVAGLFMGAWGEAMLLSVLCVAVLVALKAELERARRSGQPPVVAPSPAPAPADAILLPTLR